MMKKFFGKEKKYNEENLFCKWRGRDYLRGVREDAPKVFLGERKINNVYFCETVVD
jgi:hypothetical protein